MPNISLKLLCLGLFVCSFLGMKGENIDSEFVTLISVEHDCGNGGAIHFELNGDPDNYTVSWSHDSSEDGLILTGLEPGVYTILVENIFGCEEEHSVEILALKECVLDVSVEFGRAYCDRIIIVSILADGIPLIPESYQVIWEDGFIGHEREIILNQDSNFSMCFNVVVLGEGCCEFKDCVSIEPDKCQGVVTITAPSVPAKPCYQQINVQFFVNGALLPWQDVIVEWADGTVTNGRRVLNVGSTQVFCFTAWPANAYEEKCCFYSDCVTVKPRPGCDKAKCELVVNEFNRSASGDHQFVELLIACDGDCKEEFDIRKFIVDDNDGTLIKPNEFVNETNLDQVGINLGYLQFKDIANWSAVPNGSLIVIYSEKGKKPDTLPQDDPDDSNGDKVYVLSADNANYFEGGENIWNEDMGVVTLDLVSSSSNSSWSSIEVSNQADGMKTSDEYGNFSHGLSLGESPYAEDPSFDLWLNNGNPIDKNIRFTKSDYTNKDHFDTNNWSDNLQTPGAPNSNDNQGLINGLKECEQNFESNAISSPDIDILEATKLAKSVALVSPNPFEERIRLFVEAETSMVVTLEVYSIASELYHIEKWSLEKGKNSKKINFANKMPAGVYFFKINFPDGRIIYERVVKMN